MSHQERHRLSISVHLCLRDNRHWCFSCHHGNVVTTLDRIQAIVERLCGHGFTALGDRREAAAFGLVCKLLDGECIGQLQQMCPDLIVEERGLSNFMPPAETAALICLSFTNECVVPTTITFRCARMSPPHSKR